MIEGLGGSGKTALALEVARRYVHDYEQLPWSKRFEALVWISAKPQDLTADGVLVREGIVHTLEDVYTTIAVTLDRDEITRLLSLERSERVQSALANQRTLLIVDNLDTMPDDQVMNFLCELPPPTRVIVTSRHHIDSEYPVPLTGLSRKDGLDLIAQESKRGEVPLDQVQAEQLLDKTSGLPLAIVWCMAQMGHGKDVAAVLDELIPSGAVPQFLFEKAYERIRGRPAQQMLRALALFARDANRQAAGRVAGLTGRARKKGLKQLAQLSLAIISGDRVRILPLTREFVLGDLADAPDFVREARERQFEFYLELLRNPGLSKIERDFVLHQERENLRALLDWLVESGHHEQILELMKEFSTFLWHKGYWTDLWHYGEEALKASRESKQAGYEAYFSRAMGRILLARSDYAEAEKHLRRAQDLSMSFSSPSESATTAAYLGQALIEQGRLGEGRELLEGALVEAEWHKDDRNIARLQELLALVDLKEKRFSDVLDKVAKAKAIREADEGSLGLATIHRFEARAKLGLGQPENAIQIMRDSLEWAESAGVLLDVAYSRKWLAIMLEDHGDSGEALDLARQALELFKRLAMTEEVHVMERHISKLRHLVQETEG